MRYVSRGKWVDDGPKRKAVKRKPKTSKVSTVAVKKAEPKPEPEAEVAPDPAED